MLEDFWAQDTFFGFFNLKFLNNLLDFVNFLGFALFNLKGDLL